MLFMLASSALSTETAGVKEVYIDTSPEAGHKKFPVLWPMCSEKVKQTVLHAILKVKTFYI